MICLRIFGKLACHSKLAKRKNAAKAGNIITVTPTVAAYCVMVGYGDGQMEMSWRHVTDT
jgi:hypothetical protein